MEHTITNFKRASLFLLLFYAVFSSQDVHAQAVTEIVTDYQGYWKSGPGALLNPVKPQNSHDLLSFTFNGQRYSTGVNDALLATHGDAFSPQKFIALPMENMSGIPTAETFIGVGQLYDGVNNGPSSPPPLNNLAYYLTDGIQGLNIGTCATNIPQGYVSFQVSQVNPLSIGDGIPDILITQVAQPSGATDIYSFKDINGNTVGNSVNIVLNNLAPVGNWIADFYKVNSNPMIIPAGFVNTERPMRLWAADFADFGITAGNYQSIDHFVINLKGTTDIAFVAYNFATAVVVPLTPGIALLKDGVFQDTNGDCRASVGDKVNYTFTVTNTGQAPLTQVTVTDPLVTVSGAPISLAAGASSIGHFTATYTITQADVDAGAVYNRATVTARDPENAIITKDSSDPTPIGSGSPLYHADCDKCTVTPLLQTPTITSPLSPVNLEGCSTTAITSLPYSEVAVSITPAQFIAQGGTISNISLVLSISYQDVKSGTCPIVVTRTFTVTSGCLVLPIRQIININDTVKPTADALADLTVVGCNAAFPTADIALVTGEADNCTAVPTVTFVNDSAPVVTGCTETIIRTYKVADDCGNFIEVHQNLIRTADTVNPTASNPADLPVVDGLPAPDVTVVTDEADNCSTPTVTFISDSIPVTQGCTEVVIRTYRITDACENFIDVTQRLVKNLTTTALVVGEITQPTCSTTTGSVVLSGLPEGNWTITQSGTASNTYTGTTSTYTVAGLATGTYTFTFTSDACTSVPSAAVVINTTPTVPNAPVLASTTQPTCTVAGGSVTLSGLPATGTWTIVDQNGNTVATGTGETATISDLGAGTYSFSVITNGDCTSAASASATIVPSTNPTAAVVVNVVQPTCTVPTAAVVLSGLPSGNWTIAEIGLTGNGTANVTVNLAPGTYNLVVTNSLGCNSLPLDIPLVINPQPAAPTAPLVGTVTQPTCTLATGSIELTGLPSGNWTLNTPNGPVSGSGATYVVSGLAPNTYTFTVTVGDCTSTASVAQQINPEAAAPAAPLVGTVTQPTCTSATGSIELTGLPSGNWTLNTANGPVSGSGATYVVSGLVPNVYTFTVTVGTCTSTASVAQQINTQPGNLNAPNVDLIVQPTCSTATATVTLSGLPSGNWTLTQTGTSGNTYTGATATYTIENLAMGSYNFSVTNAAGCNSPGSLAVTINSQPVTPAAPIAATPIQPTCSVATGSVVLSGLPSGNWTITQTGTAGNTYTGSTASVTVADLAPGSYTFTVATALCTSVASTAVVISSATAPPAAPIAATPTQPTCTTTTGSVVLSGLPSGNWTLNLGDGTTIAGSGSTFDLGGLTPGTTYNISVTNSLGCESPATTVVINAAGETVNLADEACNGDDKLILNLASKLPPGTPLTGVWTNLRDNTTVTALFNPFGLPNGVYDIQYVVASGSCTQTFVVAVTVDSNLCEVSPIGDCAITWINAFSPNGDGLNDTFIIKGLDETECFPTNSIEIFNRWGVLVYDTNQYDNNTKVFRGISEGRATLSKSSELPAGTYFYIVKYSDRFGEKHEKQGYIYLSK